MSPTVKIRLTQKLWAWLAETSRQSGLSPEKQVAIRTLESARSLERPWMRQAGKINGRRSDLSLRSGFQRGKD